MKLPGIKAIKPPIGVVDSLSALLNIPTQFSCSIRNAATSLSVWKYQSPLKFGWKRDG